MVHQLFEKTYFALSGRIYYHLNGTERIYEHGKIKVVLCRKEEYTSHSDIQMDDKSKEKPSSSVL